MHGGRELVFEGQDIADKDRLKGAINEIVGRVRRQEREWTGDTGAQIEGLAQEVKGNAQKALGGVKQAVRSEVRRAQEKDEAKKGGAGSPQESKVGQPVELH